MAKCKTCKGEMLKVNGCLNISYKFPDGLILPALKYFDNEGHRCHDCNAKSGHTHHPGCDMEVCARCGGQAAFCECMETTNE